MKALLISLLVMMLSACQDYGSSIPSNELSLERAMNWHGQQFLSDRRFHSVSIGIYDSGKMVSHHAGELSIGGANPPTGNTLYELGSVSKVFAGTLAARAVLEKKITLDDDVRRYLQSHTMVSVDGKLVRVSFDNLEFNGEPVRIRHLLAHTSGFPNIVSGLNSRDEFFTEVSKIKIGTPPGDSFAYSNTAAELLAVILESVHGEPYHDTLRRLIFEPLQMSATGVVLTQEERGRLVRGYNEEAEQMPNLESSLWGGAVGVHSTSEDLLKFMNYQLSSSPAEVIESRRTLHKIRPTESIAYFWQTVEGRGTTAYRHHGGVDGMQNWLMIYPDYDIGISVVTNASFDGVAERLEFLANSLLADLLRMREMDK